MVRSLGKCVALLTAVCCATLVASKSPNIIFIVADDLGYADVGYNNPFIPTPNIDKLAKTGVLLNQSYVQQLCTPSRNAFMSGLYPFKTGLQHSVLLPTQPACLPLDKKLLPAHLKDMGYSTHMVGKWHLGYCNWNCTPTYRGFDSFFGYYNWGEDYFTHQILQYLDFRDNTEPIRTAQNKYSTVIFQERAVDIISKHNTSQPLFLYLPYQAVHNPIQAPEEYVKRCSKIQDEKRRTFCGMVAALDDAIGNVTEALQTSGLYNDSILIFTTDNGGMQGFYAQNGDVQESAGSGYNYPLRGQKYTIWEGGTRGVGFVHSPLLKKTGYTSNEMIHAVDWFATIIGLAGGEPPSNVDGMNQQDMILNGGKSLRTEFIYNLDNSSGLIDGKAGIRMGDYKLIVGPAGSPFYDHWFVPPEYKQDTQDNVAYQPPPRAIKYLFNIKDDPEERINLADKMPAMVKKLEERLAYYENQMIPPVPSGSDAKSNPQNFGGVWSPGWC